MLSSPSFVVWTSGLVHAGTPMSRRFGQRAARDWGRRLGQAICRPVVVSPPAQDTTSGYVVPFLCLGGVAGRCGGGEERRGGALEGASLDVF